MNKTPLIVGGISVASLAAGAAGGYLFAKKKFDASIDGIIDSEIDKTKKYYIALMQQIQEEADANLPDTQPTPDPEQAFPDEDFEPSDDQIILEEDAKLAQTNYQGFGSKPPLEEVLVKSNIFSNSKPTLPPRDETTGKFLPKPGPPKSQQKELTPYKIEEDVFLLNEPEHDQENLLYFVKDDTLLDTANEVVDNARVGEVNLTLFPEPTEDGASVILVRNEGLEIDYEITRTYASLTAYMGLGEDDEDLDAVGADVDDNENAYL